MPQAYDNLTNEQNQALCSSAAAARHMGRAGHYNNFFVQYCRYLYLSLGDVHPNIYRMHSYPEVLNAFVELKLIPVGVAHYVSTQLEHVSYEPNAISDGSVSCEEIRENLLTMDVRQGVFASSYSTPSCINTLANKLLDIAEGDSVVDFGCGEGTFIVQSVKESKAKASYTGMDIDLDSYAVALIRASLLEQDITIELGDMFSDKYTYGIFDKAFSNYPIGVNPSHLYGDSAYFGRVKQGLPEYGRPTSSDWIFNRLLFDSIKPGGKAVGVMTSGSALNGSDARIRRYFVDNGMIETIISLPPNLLSYTQVALSIVVMSHDNQGIRFIDATKQFEKGRRVNTLSEENIKYILRDVINDSDTSKFLTNDQIAAVDYNLSAMHVLQKEIVVPDGVPFGDLTLSIKRGASIRAEELDKLTVKQATDFQYLMLKDIVDGRISKDLPYLKELDPSLERYCIETGDLLLSKNGAPYKVAIAEVPEGKKILANGNLYVIKVDTEKVSPSYIVAFLKSNVGKELLSRASAGAYIPNLPLSNLKAIPIPLVSKEKQEEITNRIDAKLDEIEIIKLQLERARQEVQSIFDEGC